MTMTTQRIVPILVYADITAAQEYLVSTFGFAPGSLHRDQDGRVVHAEVSWGQETIWLHRVAAEHGLRGVGELGSATSMINVFVDNVEAHYANAAAAGARIQYPPTDQPYGQREYGASDSEGHIWSFASRT